MCIGRFFYCAGLSYESSFGAGFIYLVLWVVFRGRGAVSAENFPLLLPLRCVKFS
jgi:hypothetical protein